MQGPDVRQWVFFTTFKGTFMKTRQTLHAALLCLGLLSLTAAQAEMMSKPDYKAGKTRISETYKADKAACHSQSGNVKDVCEEEAKGKEKVARAELEFSYTSKAADSNKVQVVKAKAAYEVSKEKCDDLAGNAKNVCVQEAKAAEQKALADAKMDKDINKAKKTDASEKMEADYKVAIEKCDGLAGDAKASCVTAAKDKSGKK
jgi:hypothetical protein